MTTPTDKIWVDPTTFNPLNLFVIVLLDGERDFEDWGIKADTNSNWNHAMTQRNLLTFDSQYTLFQRVPIKGYLNSSNMLKFWTVNNITPEEWIVLNNAIESDLNSPWWKRLYNYLGILGQFLKQDWISMPGTNFCSQRVAKYLRLLPRFNAILPENVSPGFENNLFTTHPELVTCIGYFWQD